MRQILMGILGERMVRHLLEFSEFPLLVHGAYSFDRVRIHPNGAADGLAKGDRLPQ